MWLFCYWFVLLLLVFWVFFLSNHRGSHAPSSWMLDVFLLPTFTRLGRECQDLFSPCDGMHVCTDQTSVYTLIGKF